MKNEECRMKNERICRPEPKVKDIKKILRLVQNDKNHETNEKIIIDEIIINNQAIIQDLQIERLLSKILNSENGMNDISNFNTTTECLLQ